MVTYQQLRKKLRVSRQAHCWSPALVECPQRRGRYRRLYTVTPRKPNSAKRKVGQIYLSTGKNIFAKIPGNSHRPHRHATVLVRGSGHKDTPAVKYTVVRGAMECISLFYKTRRRSIYGVKKAVPEEDN